MMLTPEAQQRMAAVQQQQQRMAFAAQTRPGMPPGAPIQVRPGPPPGAAPVPQVTPVLGQQNSSGRSMYFL